MWQSRFTTKMKIASILFCLLMITKWTVPVSALSEDDSISVRKPASRQVLSLPDDKDAENKDDKSKLDVIDVESKDKEGDAVGDLGGGLMSVLKVDKDGTGFTHAFIASLSVIIVSELGDKTFFIAAIMAMTHSRLTVLLGALSALGIMTILSALVGYATTVIPRALTFYVSSALFAIFGLKMLREGWNMSEDEGQEEYEEVQADLKRREDELEKQSTPVQDLESGVIRTPGRRFLVGILSTVFLQALTMTFLAEWGDRSQIATIILGAREDVIGVIIGGCLGHAACTGLAVVGGRFIAQRISVRTVTLIGGVVFLIFAVSALWFGPET
ncbi:transmembrane protein 165 [Aplysia californica]|uniref:GDT1 family protein n=1 Tax=Aplysia californica TaxID=6500 RepID=A0ABM1A443_APLCA|nr:transmembrane protein 165 [Aplysia californica]